ncbi:hypothetical protein C2G38_2169546 [Gigaspora rosea]|uniref:Uncharacterized protein n=1 Tax=Gigaspora rosea TaxID=44941 RepID=A0A397VRX8_9GLOM|nr:hypothetical protein C2G38_2169546 [Gigaspora rosea]
MCLRETKTLDHIVECEESTEENSVMKKRKNLVKGLLSKEMLQDFNRNLELKMNEWEETQNIITKVKQKRKDDQHGCSERKKKVRLGQRKLEEKENRSSQKVELIRKKSKVLRKALNIVKNIVYNNIKPAWSSVIGACIKDRK